MNFAGRTNFTAKSGADADARTTVAADYALDGRWKALAATATIDMGANDAITGEAMGPIKQGYAAVILASVEFSSGNIKLAMGEQVKLENIVVTDGSESADMPVAPTFPAVADGNVPIGYAFIGNVGSGSTTGDYVPGTTALNRVGLATAYGSLAGVLPGRAPVTDVPSITT